MVNEYLQKIGEKQLIIKVKYLLLILFIIYFFQSLYNIIQLVKFRRYLIKISIIINWLDNENNTTIWFFIRQWKKIFLRDSYLIFDEKLRIL